MNNINIITNTYNGNYGSRNGRKIKNIVIGMTNNIHSGSAYASSYSKPLVPKISYHYVIDKNGSIYNTINDSYSAYTITSFNNNTQIENQESISICFMPEWNGGGCYDDYENGDNFPTGDIVNNTYFLLTKARKIKGEYYVIGLYYYDGTTWVLDEALDISELKRPYESEYWSISDDTYAALTKLTKWLSDKYDIPTSQIYRVFDFYKTYNPAPFIEDKEYWSNFKKDVANADTTQFAKIDKENVVIDTTKSENEPTATQKLVEDYGNEAGIYYYTCNNQGTCPYLNEVMFGKTCIIKKDEQVNCVNRIKNKQEYDFKGNGIIDVEHMPSMDKFTFEIGIHDITKQTSSTSNDGIITNVSTTNLWHINQTTQKVDWTTHLQNSADEMRFTFRNNDFAIDIKEGYNVGYWINGVAGFNGNIFRLSQDGSNKETINATAYGFMRYLQGDGWKIFENKTASQIFDEVCNLCNIPHRIITNSTYTVKTLNSFGTTYYDMIQKAIYETMVYEGKWYIIQPNFGTLEFRDILDPINIKQIKFSEDSAIVDWSFDSSIDESANMIITYTSGSKEDGKATAAIVGTAKDESTIREWGRLSKLIQVSDAEEGKLNVSADKWLQFYNSPRRTLKLTCQGIAGVMAGNIIYIEIDNVVSVGSIQGCLVVDECTHTIEQGKHTMQLTCEIVQDGTLRTDIYKALQEKQIKKQNETKTAKD